VEKFSYEKNGYKKSDVNKFISQVIDETKRLIDIIKKQEVKIDEMTKELDHYKNVENDFTNAVKQMEEAKESINTVAKKESDLIIEEAKTNASRIVNRALIMAKEVDLYKEKYQKEVKRLQSIAKDIEQLNID
jgi:cell division initiation protein